MQMISVADTDADFIWEQLMDICDDIESAINSPNERTLRDLMPSGEVSEDEMNRGMYEDIR